MKKYLTLKQVKSEYKDYKYIQDEYDILELITWFNRRIDELKSERSSYKEIAKDGIIHYCNNSIHIQGTHHKEVRDTITFNSTTTASNICKLTNLAVMEVIEKKEIPEIDIKLKKVIHITKSLMHIYTKQ